MRRSRRCAAPWIGSRACVEAQRLLPDPGGGEQGLSVFLSLPDGRGRCRMDNRLRMAKIAIVTLHLHSRE